MTRHAVTHKKEVEHEAKEVKKTKHMEEPAPHYRVSPIPCPTGGVQWDIRGEDGESIGEFFGERYFQNEGLAQDFAWMLNQACANRPKVEALAGAEED